MTALLERTEARCGGHPEGVHGWAIFPGGLGCMWCSAWKMFGDRVLAIDPLPTQFPAFLTHETHAPSYARAVPEQPDVDIRIMAALLPVVDERKVTFGELEQLVGQVIEIARGA